MTPREVRAVPGKHGWIAEIELEDKDGYLVTIDKDGFDSYDEALKNATMKAVQVMNQQEQDKPKPK